MGLFIGYLLILLISKRYGSEGVGIYTLTLSIVTILAIISSLGLNLSILRFIGEFKKEKNKKLKLLYLYSLEVVTILSLIISFTLYHFSYYIATNIFDNSNYKSALEMASYIIPFFALSNINIEYIRGLKNIKVSEYLRSFNRPFINIILLYFIGFYIFDILLPLYTLMGAIIVTIILSTIFIFRRVGGIYYCDCQDFGRKKLIKTSTPMMFSTLAGFIMGDMGIYMVEYYLPTSSVGVFAIAMKLSFLISIILITVNNISAPKFSELYWSGERAKLQKLIRQSSKMIFLASLIIGFIIIIFAKEILSIFGDEFIDGVDVLYLLIASQLINSFTGSVGILLNMTGHQKAYKYITLTALIISMILYYLLIPIYGIIGAGISAMIGSIIINLWAMLYAKIKLGYTTYYNPF